MDRLSTRDALSFDGFRLNGSIASPGSTKERQRLTETAIVQKARGSDSRSLEAAAADLELALDLDEQWLSYRRTWESPAPDYIRCAPEQAQLAIKRTVPLPAALLAQYQFLESKSFMGLLPEIGRAWLSIDHRLFLWDYIEGSDFVVYEELDQVISSVALATPRPGIFIDEIEYLLVIATALQVVLVGVTRSPNARHRTGTGKHGGQITLLPTGLSVPTDGIVMLKIVSSHRDGRIFMAGRDGCLHELVYGVQSWYGITPKARRLNRSRNIVISLLPGFLRRLVQADDPLIDVALDDSRHRLYTLSRRGVVTAYRLERSPGRSGHASERHSRLSSATSVLELLGSADAAGEVQKRMVTNQVEILSLYAVPSRYSRRIHLVVVSSAGERLFYTTSSASGSGPSPSAAERRSSTPRQSAFLGKVTGDYGDCLRLVGYRGPVVASLRSTIYLAFWCKGQLLAADDHEQLLAVVVDPPPLEQIPRQERDGSLLPGSSTAAEGGSSIMSTSSPSRSAVETISSLTIGGKAYAFAEAPLLSDVGWSREARSLETDPMLPSTRTEASRGFLCLTQASVVLLKPVRAIDALRQLLWTDNQDAALLDFFRRYGAAQACSWCLELALQAEQNSVEAHGLAGNAFRACLAFGGEPLLLSATASDGTMTNLADAEAQPEHLEQRALSRSSRMDGATSTWHTTMDGFSVGSASLPEVPLRFSGRHDGVVLLLARILQPIWHELITSGDDLVRIRFPFAVLLAVHSELQAFRRVMQRLFGAELDLMAKRERSKGPEVGQEHRASTSTTADETASMSSLPSFAAAWPYGQRLETVALPRSSRAGGLENNSLIGQQAFQRRSTGRQEQARRLELESIASFMGLAERSAQTLELLRTLAESTHLPRFVASLENSERARLRQTRFGEVATTEAGSQLVTSLLFKLLESYPAEERDAIESLLETLAARCPLFFGEAQVSVFRAIELLRKRDIVEAMRWLRPIANTLVLRPALVMEMKAAGAFAELIELARLAKDYRLVLLTLENLISMDEGSFEQLRSGVDQTTLQRRCLAQALASADTMYLDQVFRFMISIGSAGQELLLQVPLLLTAGGEQLLLGGSADSSPMGMLLSKAVQQLELFLLQEHVDLAWKLYAQQKRYAEAAVILLDLAEAPAGTATHASATSTMDVSRPLDPMTPSATSAEGRLRPQRSRSLSLSERIGLLTRALHFARAGASVGDARAATLVQELQDKLDVARIQQRALEELRRVVLPGTERAQVESRLQGDPSAHQTDAGLLDLSTLYNEIARPFALWETELDILRCAGHQDPELCRRLWNNIIARELALSAGVVRQRSAVLGLDSSMQAESLEPTPETLQQRFTSLARSFYPSTIAFPLDWLVASLEMLAFSRAELLSKRASDAALDPTEPVLAWSLEAFSVNWLHPTLLDVVGVSRADLVSIYRQVLEDPESFYEQSGPLPVVITRAVPASLGPWWLSFAAQCWWTRSFIALMQRWIDQTDHTVDRSLRLNESVAGYSTLARASTEWHALAANAPALLAALRVIRSRMATRQSPSHAQLSQANPPATLPLLSQLESLERELERLSSAVTKREQRYIY
jgi:nuclear pore complex protein Nup155